MWSDPWVPWLPARKPFGPQPLQGPSKVSELIDPITFTWNLSLLNSMFQQEEVIAISAIKLSRSTIHD
ncbi:hypothetical protein FRX31_008690, partial [Thalictrum thalictroides]